jgi:hypothetical protein
MILDKTREKRRPSIDYCFSTLPYTSFSVSAGEGTFPNDISQSQKLFVYFQKFLSVLPIAREYIFRRIFH